MHQAAAKAFIVNHARPVDLAVYRYFFEQGDRARVVEALAAYQNADGGFGHGLEMDFLNPASSPIATNDAIITLHRVGALRRDSAMVRDIVRYLRSRDAFDGERRRWLFALESNRDYPHASWWEKRGDGISGFNPTMSLAAFAVCYGGRDALDETMLREGLAHLEAQEDMGSDALKCYLLACELLEKNGVTDVIDLKRLRSLISLRIGQAICRDASLYGKAYVPVPSDFFAGTYLSFLTEELRQLARAEKAVLDELQMADGGFDITWTWGTPYPAEFQQARAGWRPRLTLDKLLFDSLAL
ncbi:MAG: hypothetical protein ACI4ML_13515 [Aristaeellaceae bacterium]